MYIKFLNYDTVEFIKLNKNYIHKTIKEKSFADIFDEHLGKPWYKQSKILKPDMEFVIDFNVNPRQTDIENSIRLFSSLKNLTKSQASDERFWAGYATEKKSYEYLKYRWKDTVNTINYRVVYHVSGKRGYMYHGLARLWWFAKITYDEIRSDPFELTRFTFKYPHILEKMLYRNYSNSEPIRIGIIEGIKDYIENGGDYRIYKMDILFNHISMLGSVNLLDAYSQEEIQKITLEKLLEL